MSPDRFNEDEAAAIFARAAEADAAGRKPEPAAGGMTLAELQDIGREAGLPPEAVAEAAESLRRGSARPPAQPAFLRIPIGVARTVTLERALSDAEWGELVAELRATFHATGNVRSDGGFREWRNGNLRVSAGPVLGGYQVDLRTFKGESRSLMMTGGIMGGISAAMMGVSTLAAGVGPGVAEMAPLLAVATVLFGVGAFRVPGWARRRREQFDRIAERLLSTIRA